MSLWRFYLQCIPFRVSLLRSRKIAVSTVDRLLVLLLFSYLILLFALLFQSSQLRLRWQLSSLHYIRVAFDVRGDIKIFGEKKMM